MNLDLCTLSKTIRERFMKNDYEEFNILTIFIPQVWFTVKLSNSLPEVVSLGEMYLEFKKFLKMVLPLDGLMHLLFHKQLNNILPKLLQLTQNTGVV